jgi:WD40 repeat protein
VLRFLFALASLGAVCETLAAAPVPVVQPDPLPKGATARLGTPYSRGPHAWGLTFSSDGKKLIAFDSSRFDRADKQSLCFWDADTGKKLSSKFTVPTGLDRFAKVGSVLTSERVVWLCLPRPGADEPAEIIATDLEGKVQNRIEVTGQVSFRSRPSSAEFTTAAVSSDGRYVAMALDGGQAVAVYDFDTEKRVLHEKLGKADLSVLVCFAQDRKTLFVRQSGKPIRRFELPSGKELAPLEGTGNETGRVAASPDGKFVVTLKSFSIKIVDGKAQTEYPKVLEVFEAEKGKRVGELEVGSMVTQFLFADNNNLLVWIQGMRVPLPPKLTFAKWNATTRKRVWEVPATGNALAVSPDGKRFVSAGQFQLFLHDAADGKPLVDAGGHSDSVTWVAFAPDGKTVTTVGGAEVMTWDLDGRRKARVYVPELESVGPYHGIGTDTSNDLTWSAYSREANPKLTLFGWDHKQNAIGWKIAVEQYSSWVAVPDGKHVVSASTDFAKVRTTVTIHELASGKSVREWTSANPDGLPITFGLPSLCGDGRFVVFCDGKVIKMQRAITGEEVATVKHTVDKTNTASRPLFSASRDGEKLAVCEKGKLSVYEVKSGKLLGEHAVELDSRSMKFSPDGKRLAMWRAFSDGEGHYPMVWDLGSPDAKPRKLVAEPWSIANCAAFSPDGTELVVGYFDGTALLWDLTAK